MVTDRKYTYQQQQPTREAIRLLGSPRNINHQGQILTASVLFNSNRGLWVFPSSVLFWIADSNNQPHFTHWVCCRGGHTIPRLHHSWLRATRNVNVRYTSTCHTSRCTRQYLRQKHAVAYWKRNNILCMQILILNVCIYLCTIVMHWFMRIKNLEILKVPKDNARQRFCSKLLQEVELLTTWYMDISFPATTRERTA